ncbi:PVC-type heme-binding CxxCH protein [Rhodopirellula halodulae]|uniref:PVC-type heme-binding CxxCH protein n=1 Tax=Rhodopirellula halodulae TaxID=2894198 RepID=UPI001E2D3748|nr:PVC-type heme-binding CxxCH protein [Rhodopirellula sp. JC737]MCC9657667.1 L-sorbosone dehydrogenase [Rhodopirellula sp. JC737]
MTSPTFWRSLLPSFLLAINLLLTTVGFAQNDLTDIPDPHPTAEASAMKLAPGAEVNLFAADPDIRKPIQMNFDRTGALWVASSKSYPQVKPGEIPNDQIVVLRDQDGDGVAESSTVFAEGLLIPTGVIPDGPHAAYVAASTELLHFKDTDHDGVADEWRIVLSGFGTEDTHHLVHTLRWGPDGCLYFNQSIYIHSHIDTPDGTKRLDGGGIWRYRPSTGQLEVVCKGFINPWGHVFNQNGESFVTDGAYFDGINYAFPDAVFVTSPGATRWLSGLNPGSPKHCGLEILSGTHIPSEWQGDLLTNDFRSHRVCRFSVRPNGADFVSRQQPELLTTEHVAFRPIDARMAPDGTILIADWYNPIIQHGEVDFRDPRRDTEHGRIWRVSFPDRELDPWPDFDSASTQELLGYLEDASLSVRQFSRQTLWERIEEPNFFQQVSDWVSSAEAEQLFSRTLETQWLHEAALMPISTGPSLRRLQAWKQDPTQVPENSRAWLRSQYRSAEQTAILNPGQRESVMAEAADLIRVAAAIPDPALTLETVVQCGQLNTPESAIWLHQILARELTSASSLESKPSLDFAMWQSIRNTAEHWQQGNSELDRVWKSSPDTLAWAVRAVSTSDAAKLLMERIQWENPVSDSADQTWVHAIGEVATAQQIGEALSRSLSGDTAQVPARMLALLDATAVRKNFQPTDANRTISDWLESQPSSTSNLTTLNWLARAAGQWRVQSAETALLKAIDDPKLSEAADRSSWIQSLASLESADAKQMLNRLARNGSTSDRIAAIQGMANARPGAAVALVVEALRSPDMTEVARGWLTQSLARPDLAKRYTEKISEIELASDNAREILRAVRSAGGNANLEQAIRDAGKLADATWKLTPELQSRILEKVHASGSASRGEMIYRRKELQCISCHAIGAGGGLVGPNLVSLGGSSQPDYVLESLLDPSARLKEGYSTRKILTEDGEVISGIAIGQSEESLRLRLADGTERDIEVDAILDDAPGRSLMPEGLLDDLTEAELVDLTTFLVALGRDPQYTVSTENLVRTYETLNYTAEANRRLNRTSVDTAASDDAAMTWRPLTSLVNGKLRIQELDQFKQHRQTPPTSFVRFGLEVVPENASQNETTVSIRLQRDDLPTDDPEPSSAANPAESALNRWSGLEAWVDGNPTPTWRLSELPLSRGRHQITLSINREAVSQPFSLVIEGDAQPATVD